jgi:hypothetical protein
MKSKTLKENCNPSTIQQPHGGTSLVNLAIYSKTLVFMEKNPKTAFVRVVTCNPKNNFSF